MQAERILKVITSKKDAPKKLAVNAAKTASKVIKGVGKESGITDFVSGAAQNITNTPKGLYHLARGERDKGLKELRLAQEGANKTFGSGINREGNFEYTGTGAPKVALSGAGLLSGQAIPGAALGGAIGGLSAYSDGRDVSEGVGEGAGQGVRAAGVSKLVAPITGFASQGVGGAMARAGGKSLGGVSGAQDLAGLERIGRVIGNSAAQGATNLVEDSVGNNAAGAQPNTPTQNIGSFLLGAFFGGSNAMKDLNVDADGFLRNKAGQLFDPNSGKFVKATERVKFAQHAMAAKLSQIQPSTDRPLGGMRLQPLARSRMAQ